MFDATGTKVPKTARRVIGVLGLSVLLAFGVPRAASQQRLDWSSLHREAVENLRAYLRFDTQNPPANVEAAAKFLQGLLEKEGIATKLYPAAPGKTNLLARLPAAGGRPREKAILLLNHIDVVPVDASRWKVPPFSGELRDGEIWGRGAMDMKGLGMIQLMAMVALKRAGVQLDRDLLFLATVDEETGGELGASWMIQHHYRELDPGFVLDEGGFGSRDVFAPGKLAFGISVADKRPYWIRLTTSGPAGHGSQPIPENANLRLMAALSRILERPQPVSTNPIVRQMREALGGQVAENKFNSAIQRNTISLTVLRAGVGDPPKTNVIPSRSEAHLDCRLLPGQSPDAFLEDLKVAAGPGVELQPIHLGEAAEASSTGTAFYRALEGVLRRYNPDAVVVPILVPYFTDGNKFRARGVPVYGFTPMIVDFGTISSMHSDEERIPAGQFTRGVRILFDTLSQIAGAR